MLMCVVVSVLCVSFLPRIVPCRFPHVVRYLDSRLRELLCPLSMDA